MQVEKSLPPGGEAEICSSQILGGGKCCNQDPLTRIASLSDLPTRGM
jgi:hypothetical protein